MIYSEDFDEIYQQQLAIPIHVPKELEQYIERTMRNVCRDHGMDWSDEMNVLIPVLNDTPNTPPPSDVSWHIRFWVIGNVTMWAKLDPRVDEYYLPLFFYSRSFTHQLCGQDLRGPLDVIPPPLPPG
jgi:hypothetical protein